MQFDDQTVQKYSGICQEQWEDQRSEIRVGWVAIEILWREESSSWWSVYIGWQ